MAPMVLPLHVVVRLVPLRKMPKELLVRMVPLRRVHVLGQSMRLGMRLVALRQMARGNVALELIPLLRRQTLSWNCGYEAMRLGTTIRAIRLG
jgi:hypothetical protein